MDNSAFAGHSFRRGGASWAYHAGLGVDTISQIGDWQSNSYTKYIVEDENSLRFRPGVFIFTSYLLLTITTSGLEFYSHFYVLLSYDCYCDFTALDAHARFILSCSRSFS